MGTSLTGKQIKNTYKSLIKTSDSTEASATAKLLSDGNGNDFGVYIDTDGVFGIGSAPSYSLDVSSRTDGVALPVGTTANRPTPTNGLLRYNSTIGKIEFYDGGWKTVFTTSGGTIDGSLIVTGDLTIQGTTVTLNTETVQFEDNILLLNRASADTQYDAVNAGIEIKKTSATNPSFLYTYSTSTWGLTDSLTIEGNLTVDTNTLYVDSADNRVGIGTLNPVQALDVDGKVRITDDIILAQTNGRIDYDNGTSGALRFYSTSTASERMRIDSSGDLTIKGGRIIVRESDDGADAVKITRDADEGYVQVFGDGVQTVEIRGKGDSYFNGGNVGIGVSPVRKLDVDSGTSSDIVRFGNDNGSMTFGQSASLTSLDLATSNAYRIRQGASTPFYINTTGNVGIGTTSPSAALVVLGSAKIGPNRQAIFSESNGNNSAIIFSSTGNMEFRGSETDYHQLFLKSGGNVGIGTTSPVALLHINGSGDAIRVTSTNTGAGGAQIDLLHYTTSPADNDVHGVINFGGYYSGTSSAYGSAIKSVWSDVSAKKADLQFFTRNDANFSSRMTIDSSGNVKFNTSVQIGYYEADGVHDGYIVPYNSSGQLEIVNSFSTGGILFKTGTSKAERMRIDSSGWTSLYDAVGDAIAPLTVARNTSLYNYINTVAAFGNYTGGTAEHGFLINSFGDALGGSFSSNYRYTNNTGSIENTGRSSGEFRIVNQGSGGSTFEFYSRNVGTSTMNPVFYIAGTGNVGIGTTGPLDALHVQKDGVSSYATTTIRNVNSTAYLNIGVGGSLVADSTLRNNAYIIVPTAADLVFRTSNAERMRITSGGDIDIPDGNITLNDTGNLNGTKLFGGDTNGGIIYFYRGSGSGTQIMRFYVGNSQVGSISTATGTSTSFNTTSDYRLKENVVPMEGALDRVDALKPSRFNFIADADKTVDGFLAHEVADVVPEAISGEKDAVDEEGNAIYQGIDQSKLVPLLVGAIQEQQEIINDLKARIETLENQ